MKKLLLILSMTLVLSSSAIAYWGEMEYDAENAVIQLESELESRIEELEAQIEELECRIDDLEDEL